MTELHQKSICLMRPMSTSQMQQIWKSFNSWFFIFQMFILLNHYPVDWNYLRSTLFTKFKSCNYLIKNYFILTKFRYALRNNYNTIIVLKIGKPFVLTGQMDVEQLWLIMWKSTTIKIESVNQSKSLINDQYQFRLNAN